jgi:hypothetical protein
MQFYPIWLSYDSIGKERYGKDWYKYYTDALIKKIPMSELDNNRFTRESLRWEFEWIKAHKPYYQIWPGVADEFIKTRIDINTSLLKAPHNIFGIRLPVLDTPLLSFEYPNNRIATIECIMVLHDDFMDINNEDKVLSWRVTFRVNGIDNPGNMGFRLHLTEGQTIEQCIGHFISFREKDLTNTYFTVPVSIQDAILRLIVGVHFLATGSHKILEYDVLSRHLDAYRRLKEDDPKRIEYETKAKEKGKFGWNIGAGRSDRWLKLPAGISYEQAIKNAGGNRELLYQHLRGGHWHTVKYGKDRKLDKVVWFDETTVRPDLPPKQIKMH